MKKLRCENGFTLVQMIVVIAILGILAGIAIPRFMEAKKESERVACLAHRKMIERSWRFAQSSGEYESFADFLDAVKTDEDVDNKYFHTDPLCPSEGTYSISEDGNYVVCSVSDHSEVAVIDDNVDSITTDTTTNDDTITNDDTTTTDTSATKVNVEDLATEDWAEMLKLAAEKYPDGISLDPSGLLYEDETGIYLIRDFQYLTAKNGLDEISIATYAETHPTTVIKIDLDQDVLTSANQTTLWGYTVWETDSLPEPGSLYKDGDDYYVRKYTTYSRYDAVDVTDTNQWIKVSADSLN
jgi:prepilin-type N-terminal cleavage/methylation domain-containing protein